MVNQTITIILILLLILLLLILQHYELLILQHYELFILQHYELFIVNPKSFMGKNSTNEELRDMRKFRDCENVVNKEYCILKNKKFITHLPITKLPWKKYVNYHTTQDSSDLLPQTKPSRPYPNI